MTAAERMRGDFQLECMRGKRVGGWEQGVAICCDEKKMGMLALFHCSGCRRDPSQVEVTRERETCTV